MVEVAGSKTIETGLISASTGTSSAQPTANAASARAMTPAGQADEREFLKIFMPILQLQSRPIKSQYWPHFRRHGHPKSVLFGHRASPEKRNQKYLNPVLNASAPKLRAETNFWEDIIGILRRYRGKTCARPGACVMNRVCRLGTAPPAALKPLRIANASKMIKKPCTASNEWITIRKRERLSGDILAPFACFLR